MPLATRHFWRLQGKRSSDSNWASNLTYFNIGQDVFWWFVFRVSFFDVLECVVANGHVLSWRKNKRPPWNSPSALWKAATFWKADYCCYCFCYYCCHCQYYYHYYYDYYHYRYCYYYYYYYYDYYYDYYHHYYGGGGARGNGGGTLASVCWKAFWKAFRKVFRMPSVRLKPSGRPSWSFPKALWKAAGRQQPSRMLFGGRPTPYGRPVPSGSFPKAFPRPSRRPSWRPFPKAFQHFLLAVPSRSLSSIWLMHGQSVLVLIEFSPSASVRAQHSIGSPAPFCKALNSENQTVPMAFKQCLMSYSTTRPHI